MTIDILINALLKSMGYDREKFEAQIVTLKTQLDDFAKRAERSESLLIDANERTIRLENRLDNIEFSLRNICAYLKINNSVQNGADYIPGEPHFTAHNTLEN